LLFFVSYDHQQTSRDPIAVLTHCMEHRSPHCSPPRRNTTEIRRHLYHPISHRENRIAPTCQAQRSFC
jgi:hypothetical protein